MAAGDYTQAAKPPMKLLDQLLQATSLCLARHESHFASGPLLAAVSGGRDSTVLAWLLSRLHYKGRLSGEVIVAHVDHGIHNDSAAAAEHVRDLCAELDLPFVSERLEGVLPSEEALRDARYEALIAMARGAGSKVVITGHHGDDNMETVLFRMLRGTGPRGLAGIPEFRRLTDDVAVVRPLLRIRKTTLHWLLELLGLSWFEDPTNADLSYARNRLRREVIPSLKRALGARLDLSLIALIRTARAVTDLLDTKGRRLVQDEAEFVTPWRCEFEIPQVDAENRSFLEEALCQVHEQLHPDRCRPPWTWVSRVLELLDSHDGRRVSGKKSLLAERTRRGLLLVDATASGAPPQEPVPVPAEGSIHFGTTEWQVSCRQLVEPPLDPSPWDSGSRRALLDPRDAEAPWRLRCRAAGDRFWPLGARGPVDLRRFMQNRHVPRFDRSRLPLLVDGKDRILWVPGVEIAAPARIRLDSETCYEVKLSIVGSEEAAGASY